VGVAQIPQLPKAVQLGGSAALEREGGGRMGKRTGKANRIENILLTIVVLSLLLGCFHLTFKEGGAWDYNMEQVLK
jgi:hypothetical protein